MPTSSTLTEQLASLGVYLPAWPEEPQMGDAAGDWIQRGQAYAEGVRLWRAQLRNAPLSTKGVVHQLLQHLETSDRPTHWDRWLHACIHPEVRKTISLDRWKQSTEILQDAPLSNAQVLGGVLAFADAQQLASAVIGTIRLVKDGNLDCKEVLVVCSLLTSSSDTEWRINEGRTCPKAYKTSVDICLRYTKLLVAALRQCQDHALDARQACHKSVLSALEDLLDLIGEEDQWSGIPKAQTLQILNQSGLEASLVYLEKQIPWSVPRTTHAAHARLLATQLLINSGEWEHTLELSNRSVAQLNEYAQLDELRTSQLEIILAETELIAHELSLALSNGSLAASSPSQTEGTQQWQSLSRSQLGQDLWVLEQVGWKQGGFFVEFGATDGVLLNNSWLLEKYFGWNGICAEPNPKLFQRLRHNRSCILSPACVYRISGKTMRFILADAYGGIEDFGREDQHVDIRSAYAEAGNVISLTTVSLMDLLSQHKAPEIIDYLSIDTEGSELAILEGIDWSRYQFRCITVEHNFTEQRQGIRNLLEAQGYQCQERDWDDWYVKSL